MIERCGCVEKRVHTTPETDFTKETDRWSVLEQALREGDRRMLQQTFEREGEKYFEKHSGVEEASGKESCHRC